MCEHNIKEKIEQLESDLQQIVTEHNQLVERKNTLLNAATEIQGALKVLKELDNGDQPPEGETTGTSRHPSDVLQTAYSRRSSI